MQTWQGCDSTVTLNLIVNPTKTTTLNQTICDNQSFTVGNSTYTTSGTYTDILQTWQGCDSTVTLNLIVNPTKTTTLNQTICDNQSFTVGNSTYTTSGTYTDILQTWQGCDSTVTLNLIVNPTQTTTLNQTICDNQSFSVGNSTYTTSGTYTDILQTWQGCDSTVTLDLVVQSAITILDSVIIDGSNVPLGSIDITPSGDTTTQQYLWSNGSTMQDISNLGTGFYGLTITDNIGCQDTFSFEIGTVNTFFVDNKQQIQAKLYPNPTRRNQSTTLEFDNVLSNNLHYQIISIDGKIVSTGEISKGKLKHKINVPQEFGTYYLQLLLNNQQLKVIPFIVK